MKGRCRQTTDRPRLTSGRRLRFQFLEHRDLLSAATMDAAGRFVLGGNLYDRDGALITQLKGCGGSIAATLDDGFVSACSLVPPGERRKSVYVQRYDRDGQPLGDPVNITGVGIDQVQPTVAVDATGHVIVSWMDQVSELKAIRLSSDLNVVGQLITISDTRGVAQPNVASALNGDFAVAYTPYKANAFVHTFDVAGMAKAARFQMGESETSRVTMSAAGEYLATWGVSVADVDDAEPGAQGHFAVFSNQGALIHQDVVGTPQFGWFETPTPAMLWDGQGIVSWSEGMQFLDSNGQKVGPVVPGAFAAYSRERIVSFVDGSVTTLMESTAPPLVTRVHVTGDDRPIDEGERLINVARGLTIHFVGDVEIDSEPDNPHSAGHSANWRLNRNGTDISHLIERVDVEPDVLGYGPTVHLILSAPLGDGSYTLHAADAIQSSSGYSIDGDYDGHAGGGFSRSFTIAIPAAVGPEIAVNQYSVGEQRTSPASLANLAMQPDGAFVTTWASLNQDGSGWGVYARNFDAEGRPFGNEYLISQVTAGHQRFSTASRGMRSGVVFTWSSENQDGDGYGVYARRFSSGPQPNGNEFRVNVTTAGFQGRSAVAVDDDGDFVVVWESEGQDGFGYGVFGRQYDRLGKAKGTEFQINQYALSDQRLANVAMDPDGDFVVTWSSFGQDGSGYGVYARRYDSLGQPLTDEFRVNSTTGSTQRNSQIAMDRTGDFIITWMSNGADGDGYGIYAQRFGRDGTPQGQEFRVNTTTTGHQQYPAIGRDEDGDTVIAWASQDEDGDSWGVYARRYDPKGRPQGEAFRVNSTTRGQQTLASVGVDADGDFTIAWDSENQDGDGFGVFAQRFSGIKANNPPIADAGGPYSIAEGATLWLTAEASSDPDAGDTLTFAWDIDGDGQFDDAVGESTSVSWAELQALGIADGPAVVSGVRVRATDSAGNADDSAATTLEVRDLAPSIALVGLNIVNEGASYTLQLGTITDPGNDTVTSWTVHWGDGTSETYLAGGAKTHVYADSAPNYTIIVDLLDEDGLHVASGAWSVNVINVRPQISGLAASATDENGTSFLRGTIVDPGSQDSFELHVYWGDTETAEVIPLPAGTRDIEIPHHYLDDPFGPPPDEYPIDVLLRDDDGGFDTESIRVTVRNLAPLAEIVGLLPENPIDQLVTLTANVSDPGPLDIFTTTWRVERNGVLYASGSGDQFSFTPDAEGTYAVALTATDDDAGTTVVTANVRVPGGSLDGDTNQDGLVDVVDLNNVRNNFGGTGLGDANGDGLVDVHDLNAVRNNFGARFPAPQTSQSIDDLNVGRPRSFEGPASSNLVDAVFAQFASNGAANDSASMWPVLKRRRA